MGLAWDWRNPGCCNDLWSFWSSYFGYVSWVSIIHPHHISVKLILLQGISFGGFLSSEFLHKGVSVRRVFEGNRQFLVRAAGQRGRWAAGWASADSGRGRGVDFAGFGRILLAFGDNRDENNTGVVLYSKR